MQTFNPKNASKQSVMGQFQALKAEAEKIGIQMSSLSYDKERNQYVVDIKTTAEFDRDYSDVNITEEKAKTLTEFEESFKKLQKSFKNMGTTVKENMSVKMQRAAKRANKINEIRKQHMQELKQSLPSLSSVTKNSTQPSL